ncbi:FAD-dependent oxidoreductase [Acidobacteriota bacterium]
MKKKVLVLGGGITGLGSAWKLAENGVPVELIELKEEIGGLAGTVKEGPYRLDYGPHFILSERPELLQKILTVFDEELPVFKRSAQLYFHGKFYNYPLTARNVLLQMPIYDSFLCAASYFVRLIWNNIRKPFRRNKKPPNFEEWAKNSFGDYLFRLFFKPYTEQFWQIPVRELSPDSMPTNTRLSFFKTLKLLFVKDIVKSKMSLVERETTLLLRYPKQGIGELADKIAKKIEENETGNIHTGCRINDINRKKDGSWEVSAICHGETRVFSGDHVISTLPVTELIPMLSPAPPPDIFEDLKHLGFLSLIVVYIVIPKREILESSYVYHLATPYNRIGDMNKFCPDLCPEDENMLALEFTCHQGDSHWEKSKEELFEESIKYLEKDGIISRDEVKRIFVLKAPQGYPVYTYGYKKHLDSIRNYINSIPELDIVGRAGNYQYMDMDQCMHLGFLKAEEIMNQKTE